MGFRMSEEEKADIGLLAEALNNTNATGKYYPVQDFRRIWAVLNGGAMAATKTTIIAILQATDADGTGAKAITSGTATVTANAKVTEATIELASVANTDVVKITPYNGATAGTELSFTKAASTTAADREFANAAGLVTCINDPDYGVPGITASVNGTVVTVQATVPGERTVSLDKTENAGTITLATVSAQAFVEIDGSDLDFENDFVFVAVKVTTTANSVVSGTLLRGNPREKAVTQQVGASSAL